ncbi:hypothetical protein O6H91_23G071200 [Diphasiastrum complanatum]|uniref:Uncharacterized protein n=1 Tax=Diphasiastrum complanatum TaxID=34168 RepID=A0ACC2ABX7_DIPCM|nr:hypothetical protein O6H91_23G071200 [Diphasiastrum complanatum]
MACVYIPVQNTLEEVKVVLDQLPRDAADILDILKAEQAPLHLWLTFAREYFKQGKMKEFLQILEEGSSPEIDEYYQDVKYERIAILNALGAYYTNLGKIELKQREKDEYFMRATHYYNKVSHIDQHEPSTWVGKGQLLLAKGELDQSYSQFKIALEEQKDNIPALLGQTVLQLHPGCPASVRLGIGLCRYRLGQPKKAREAFNRTLQLDPENVEALVALGIMDLNTNEIEDVHEGMTKMQAAFEIHPFCAMALNHLANHYFFTGDHYIVEQLMDMAFVATDHPRMKAHSFFNLARSHHSKGDYERASVYYRASVNELKDPHDFILPYYGLGQVQLKLGDLKTALSNFEKVLEVHPENCESLKAVGYIFLQQGRLEKALQTFKKATRINPRDVDAWIEMGELLLSSDLVAALDAFNTAHSLLKKGRDPMPTGLLNNIGVLHFERGEFELAQRAFCEALGDGFWRNVTTGLLPGDVPLPAVYGDRDEFFYQLENEGVSLEVPAGKITVIFNLARLFEQQHQSDKAVILYQLILFKHPKYVDAHIRLAAMAQARNNISLSMELVNRALKEDEINADALSFRGNLELRADDWLKAKETLKGIQSMSDGKDSYSTLALGNWNYYAATRGEKKDPKLEATHLEKARELYQKVLVQRPNNLYAANGLGVVLAEKGLFDISKDIFTQVQEAASGNITVQMPDVWINLAHVFVGQGQFGLAVKMYQNCLRRFYFNTETNVLLYLARSHYEAEQWQECKSVLLRAIHLAPSNYMLRFDAAIAMQKFSTATLQKSKRSADEVRQSVSELKNALRLFSQLSGISSQHSHGFDEKKIEMHVEYCKHLLDAAKVHLEAAEREEQQNKQKQELARQAAMAEEARRKAEEERKLQMERRKREEELKRVLEQEEYFERIKETWKVQGREKFHAEDNDGEGGANEKKEKRKEKRKRKKEKRSKEQDSEWEEKDDVEGEPQAGLQNEELEEGAQDALAAAGLLEDSDEEDAMEKEAIPPRRIRRKHAVADSDEEDMGIQDSPAAAIPNKNESDVEVPENRFLEDSEEETFDTSTALEAKKRRISDSESE